MPTLKISSIPSQQKTISSSSPQRQDSKFKSDEIIKDSDDEGDVLPPINGNQKPESKRKHKDRSIRTKASAAISTGPTTRERKRDILSAAVIDSSNPAISTGTTTRKRKRDILSAAVIDSSDPLSDSNISGSESGSGNEDSVEGSDKLSKTKEKK